MRSDERNFFCSTFLFAGTSTRSVLFEHEVNYIQFVPFVDLNLIKTFGVEVTLHISRRKKITKKLRYPKSFFIDLGAEYFIEIFINLFHEFSK